MSLFNTFSTKRHNFPYRTVKIKGKFYHITVCPQCNGLGGKYLCGYSNYIECPLCDGTGNLAKELSENEINCK